MTRPKSADARPRPGPGAPQPVGSCRILRIGCRFATLPLRIRAALVRRGLDLRRRWYRYRSLGARGERYAARYLRRQGMKIVGRQVRLDEGELDLVAVDGRTVVFVEVKTRRTGGLAAALESITPHKQRRLARLALTYLRRHGLQDYAARIDVIAIAWPPGCRRPELRHVRSAVGAIGVERVLSH